MDWTRLLAGTLDPELAARQRYPRGTQSQAPHLAGAHFTYWSVLDSRSFRGLVRDELERDK